MLSQLFTPIEESGLDRYFFDYRYIGHDETFDVNSKGIALVIGANEDGQELRKCLNGFKNHFNNIKLFDLGKLKSNDARNVESIIKYFETHNVVGVFVGLSIDEISKVASLMNLSVLQIANNINSFTDSSTFITSNYVAYQRHLCELDDIHEIESQLFNSMSLGRLRTHLHLNEPVLRSAEILYINLNALKASDISEVNDTLPTGLNAEELCQLSKFAGTANHLKAVFFDTSNISNHHKSVSDNIAASIWYLSEGLNMKISDHPTESKDFAVFLVNVTTSDDEMEFISHNLSNRMWLKRESNGVVKYLACSYDEYQACINDEIPDRIQNFLNKE